MAKRNKGPRKPSGAAAISVIEDEVGQVTEDTAHGAEESEVKTEAPTAEKPARTGKAKSEPPLNDQIGISDIRKAAAFVNSIGGLEKAIALLQILKVAKEVQ